MDGTESTVRAADGFVPQGFTRHHAVARAGGGWRRRRVFGNRREKARRVHRLQTTDNVREETEEIRY